MSSLCSLIKYLQPSKNSTKAEKGMSIRALKKAAKALYFFHLLEIHFPRPCMGRKKTSVRKLKNPSFSSSMVSSCARLATAVPANKIRAIKIMSIIIELTENPRLFKIQKIAPYVMKAEAT